MFDGDWRPPAAAPLQNSTRVISTGHPPTQSITIHRALRSSRPNPRNHKMLNCSFRPGKPSRPRPGNLRKKRTEITDRPGSPGRPGKKWGRIPITHTHTFVSLRDEERCLDCLDGALFSATFARTLPGLLLDAARTGTLPHRARTCPQTKSAASPRLWY